MLTLTACGASTVAPTAAPATHAPVHAAVGQGVHGMVVFGGAHIYASHLPLYHHPHAAQVVVELAPDEPLAGELRTALAAATADTSSMITFEPDRFDLGTLEPGAAAPRALTGTLYRGHFERGGTPWREHVSLGLRRVVVFRALDAGAHEAARADLAFGDGDEVFLLHRIGGRPSCDRIDALRGPAPGGASELVDGAGDPADDPCAPPTTAMLAARGWSWQRLVYLERDDLK